MKKVILIVTIWFMIIDPGIGQKNIKIMTYNIRLDHAGDNDNNWHQRKEDLAAFIIKTNPDFLGVQEALIHQAEYLDGALKDHHYIGVGRDDGKQKGEIMGIFYLKDKWKLITDSTIWLSENPKIPSKGWDANFYRTCTYGLFEDMKNESIAVFNTHFDHQAENARKNSVPLLKNFIQNMVGDQNFILMGDMNATPDTEIYKNLITFSSDAYHLAKSLHTSYKGSFNGFNLLDDFSRRIDYIFVSKAYNVIDYSMPAPKTKNGRQLSDHFPVIITIN